MTKYLKRLSVLFLFIFLLPFAFLGGGEVAKAEDNLNHYIKNTVNIKKDDKVSVSLVFSVEFPDSYNALQVEAFKTELLALLDLELEEKRQEINVIYSQESFEKYNPATQIIFGDKGHAVKGDGYVGYAIEYSSIEVYQYYNKFTKTIKKGSF